MPALKLTDWDASREWETVITLPDVPPSTSCRALNRESDNSGVETYSSDNLRCIGRSGVHFTVRNVFMAVLVVVIVTAEEVRRIISRQSRSPRWLPSLLRLDDLTVFAFDFDTPSRNTSLVIHTANHLGAGTGCNTIIDAAAVLDHETLFEGDGSADGVPEGADDVAAAVVVGACRRFDDYCAALIGLEDVKECLCPARKEVN